MVTGMDTGVQLRASIFSNGFWALCRLSLTVLKHAEAGVAFTVHKMPRG